jgi:hypothetical protein
VYDWTEEGRSKIYAHWGRYWRPATLDEPEPETIDEALGGAEYELIEDLTAGVSLAHRSDHDAIRVNARSRLRWLRAHLIYDSHLGLDLRASAQLSFLSPRLVGVVRVHTAERVPSSVRVEYYDLLWGQKVRWFGDVLIDEQRPDIRAGLRADW